MAATPQRKASLMDHNLKVLQRNDPDTNNIVAMAYHTVVYKLDDKSKSWEREDVEGALFLVTRTCEPWHRIVVRNRQSATDLIQDVDSSFVYEIKDPYVMFQNNDGVRCLWIPEAQDRAEIFESFTTSIGPQYMPKMNHQVVLGSLNPDPPSPAGATPPTTPLLHPSQLLSGHVPQPHSQPLTPATAPMNQSNYGRNNPGGINPVLTKDELRHTLVSLIQTDEMFLDVIHRQYLKTRHGQQSPYRRPPPPQTFHQPQHHHFVSPHPSHLHQN